MMSLTRSITRERAAYIGAVLATMGLIIAVTEEFEIGSVTYPLMPPWALGVFSGGFLVYSFIYLRWYA